MRYLKTELELTNSCRVGSGRCEGIAVLELICHLEGFIAQTVKINMPRID